MKKLLLITKTELHQLKQDRRLHVALIIFLFIFLTSVTTLMLAGIEYSYLNNNQNIIPFFYQTSEGTGVFIFLFCILSFSVCSLVVADLTAGEKERNTLETLFLTQCPRYIIFWGKFTVAYMFSLIPLILGFPIIFILSLFLSSPFLSISEILRIVLLMIPYSFMISNLMIYNGFKAKTIRSAKSSELVIFLGIPFFSIIVNDISGLLFMGVYYFIMAIFCFFIISKTINYIKSESVLYSI